MAAQNAIDGSKALHARRWQTKDGTYRLKKHVLPDVRDGQDIYDDADASASDAILEEHDQELFLEAYTAFTTKSDEVGSVDSLRRWFSSVERLPDSWPLARLSITLDGLTSQLSKVVMSATMEIIASCRYPDYGLPSVTQLAKDVTVALALHLADLLANWLLWKQGMVRNPAIAGQKFGYHIRTWSNGRRLHLCILDRHAFEEAFQGRAISQNAALLENMAPAPAT